jgi:hypothetical protein
MGIPISKAVWVLEALCIGCYLQVSGTAVTFTRFSLNINPHLHIIAADGCFYGYVEFMTSNSP